MEPENSEKKDSITPPKIKSRVLSGNSWLNDGEAAKGEKLRIVLPSTLKKHHPIRNSIIWVIILAGLGFGGYKAYPKYWPKIMELINKKEQKNPVVQNYLPELNPATTAEGDIATNTSASLPISTPNIGVPSTTPSSTPTAVLPPLTGPSLKVNSNTLGYLNVRSEPSSSGNIVTKVHPGESYPYTGTQYDWYKITLPSGKFGWVSGQYVTLQ